MSILLTVSSAVSKAGQANEQLEARVRSTPLWVESDRKATKTVSETIKTEN